MPWIFHPTILISLLIFSIILKWFHSKLKTCNLLSGNIGRLLIQKQKKEEKKKKWYAWIILDKYVFVWQFCVVFPERYHRHMFGFAWRHTHSEIFPLNFKVDCHSKFRKIYQKKLDWKRKRKKRNEENHRIHIHIEGVDYIIYAQCHVKS